jgi:hypothetical protein
MPRVLCASAGPGEGGDSAFEGPIQQLLEQAHPGLHFPAEYAIAAEENAFAPSCGVPTEEMRRLVRARHLSQLGGLPPREDIGLPTSRVGRGWPRRNFRTVGDR